MTETVYTGHPTMERPRVAERRKTLGRVAEERIAELRDRADTLDREAVAVTPETYTARAEAARANADQIESDLAGERRTATLEAVRLGNELAESQSAIIAHLDESATLIETHNELDREYRVALSKCRGLGAEMPETVSKLSHRIGTKDEDRAIRATLGRARRAGLPT
jgi:hypothetical protein